MKNYLEPIIKSSVTRSVTLGSTILYQGEVPRSAFLLVEGIVRVYSISSQGEEQTVTYLVAGEVFPSSWIFSKATSTLFFYEATTDCVIGFVKKEHLLEFIYEDKERLKAMLDYFATNYSAALLRINALEQSRARDKLVYTLLFLCQRYGNTNEDKVLIPLKLTHQNIANLVGLTRETTASEMSKLKKLAIIGYKQQHYTVTRSKLLTLIGEDNFMDVRLT